MQKRSEQQVSNDADLLLKTMNSVRDYTSQNVGPHSKAVQQVIAAQIYVPAERVLAEADSTRSG